MERLTFEGNFCDIALCGYPTCPYKDGCSQKQVWERLKQYEDTGLEPEAVETVKLALCAKHMVDLETLNNTPISRLVELAEADKDGRVVVLPCKVGDTVYFALLGRIIEKQVFSIVSFSNSTRIYCGGTSEYFRPEDIGKTFFLAREEAEKALEKMEGKMMVKRICDRCGAEINPTSSATYVNVRGAYRDPTGEIELCCSCGKRIREWLKPTEEGKKDG